MESIFMFIFVSMLGLSYAAFEMCAQADLISGVSLSIYKKEDGSMAKFVIKGPSTKWFAYGIGNDVMNGTYAVIGYGSTLTVEERVLGASSSTMKAGFELTSSNAKTMDDSNGVRTITIEVPTSFSRAKDLQSFLDCQTADYEMDVIAALGSDTNFPAYHASRIPDKIMNVCCMEMSTSFYIVTDNEDATTTPAGEEEPATTPGADGIEQMKYIWNIVCVVFMAFIIIN